MNEMEVIFMADKLVLGPGEVSAGMIESMIAAHAAGIPITVEPVAPDGRARAALVLCEKLAQFPCVYQDTSCVETAKEDMRCVSCRARVALGLPQRQPLPGIEASKDPIVQAALAAPSRFGLAYFSADWCGPCKTLKPRLESFAAKHG